MAITFFSAISAPLRGVWGACWQSPYLY